MKRTVIISLIAILTTVILFGLAPYNYKGEAATNSPYPTVLNTDVIPAYQTNVGLPQTNWNLFQTNTNLFQNNLGFPQSTLNFTTVSPWGGYSYINTIPSFSNTQGWNQLPQTISYPTTFMSNAANNLTGLNLVNTLTGLGNFISNRAMTNYYPTNSQQGLPQATFSSRSPFGFSSLFNPPSFFQPPQSAIQYPFPGGSNSLWPWPFTYPSTTPSQTTTKTQKLFEASYTNYAWGYQHKGFYINDDGTVYSFQNQGQSENSGDTVTYEMTIDPVVLSQKQSLIGPASAGPYSERTNTAFDFGTTLYVCYSGNNEIILKETGDWSQENQSQSAQELVAWLEDISQQINMPLPSL